MIIQKINIVDGGKKCIVNDCEAQSGFRKMRHGSLPDVDIDFDADRRDQIKAYLERRYNKEGQHRVFSAGTFTTERIRSVIKDVARTYRVSQPTVNYITKILDEDLSWTGLMKVAATDKRIREFVNKYPDVIEQILPIMGQPRAAGIHASAVIVAPEYINGEKVDCFDLLPIRKMGDILVSEISGAEIDILGVLKNDVLGIKELTRLSDMFKLIKEEYGIEYTLHNIINNHLNDPDVFQMVSRGKTQGVFQINGGGITKFIQRMKPDNIHDIIATVALYRPGPLGSGASDNYIHAKKEEYDPEYLWGTYDILKDTYGQMIYQEQLSQLAQKIGGLSISDAIDLVKAISKKKLEKVRAFQDKFFKGAEAKGCPKDAAKRIWSDIEEAAKYSFNRAHATLYGLTAYIGAWIKVHYPAVFYTVALKDQKEEMLPILLNEIDSMEILKLMPPDINVSRECFVGHYKENKIYWSLSRIKNVGIKAVDYILREREIFGKFSDMEDFISRIFRNRALATSNTDKEDSTSRNPVTTRVIKCLIYSGAFDEIEHLTSVAERYGLLCRAGELLGFEITDDDAPAELRDAPYFWNKQQIAISGHGSIDYRTIFDTMLGMKAPKTPGYVEFKSTEEICFAERKGFICATITGVSDKTFKDKQTGETRHFGKIDLQQNTHTNILTIWADWPLLKPLLNKAVGKMLIAKVNIKWSDYDGKHVFEIGKSSIFKVI